MTLREAQALAETKATVYYDGTPYQRIVEIGIAFPEQTVGDETTRLGVKVCQYVTLLDRNGRSTIRVRPEQVNAEMRFDDGTH